MTPPEIWNRFGSIAMWQMENAANRRRAACRPHPGHCAGQVAFLWQGERLLIAGDVGMYILGLGDPVGFKDIEEGRRGLRKVATLRFNAAVFGHGRPIHSGASERIRSKMGR
jgi:glyoxylase-like metal-dependent hydrolase (beta-lactamase superfamily II)